MHYRKQPDGRSWLIFELTDNNQKRGMALVRRADNNSDPLMEWLTVFEDENPAVLALGKKILEKQRKPVVQTVMPLEEAPAPSQDSMLGPEPADTVPPASAPAQPEEPPAPTDETHEEAASADAQPVEVPAEPIVATPRQDEGSTNEEPLPAPSSTPANQHAAPEESGSAADEAAGLKVGIFCEGETEQRYIRYLAKYLQVENKIDVRVSDVKDPGSAFKQIAAKFLWDRQVGENEFSEIWLVFDRDSHAHFESALKMAPKFPFMHLAFTNPSIEYWFLLHFAQFPGDLPLDTKIVLSTERREEKINGRRRRVITEEVIELTTSNAACLELLRSYCPGYEKNSDNCMHRLRELTMTAYHRAKQLPSPADGHGSGMPDLIDRLCALTGLPLAEAHARLGGDIHAATAELDMGFFRRCLNLVAQTAQAVIVLDQRQKKFEQNLPDDILEACTFCKNWLGTQIPASIIPEASPDKDQQLAILPCIQSLCNNFTRKGSRPKDKKVLARLYAAIEALEANIRADGER